jgi:dihydroflavonol-4-reductase
VAKTLVTGGTGFLGSHVVRRLIERGDDVRVTVRRRSRLENLEGLDYEPATSDILDRRAVRRALRGVDRVFHVAGLTSLRASADRQFEVNAQGTRIVLEESLRAAVDRVVHTSSVAAIGPAPRGSTADERQVFRAGGYGIPYVNAKHEAELEAFRQAAAGLPVVVVNPGHIFGPGDIYRSSTELVRRYMLRQIPAYVEGALNIVDVRDVARGILLADDRGRPGERYILGNRNYTHDRLFADLGRLSGVEPPAVKLPLPAALAAAHAAEQLPGRPPITVAEVRLLSMWWAFRSGKAQRELGWKPEPHEETVEATVEWYRERLGDRLRRSSRRQPLPLRAAGFAVRQVDGVARRLTG